MKSVLFARVLGAIALAVPLAAQQPAAAVAQAWSRFLAENGHGWIAEWCPATGTPEAIYGTGLALTNTPIHSLERARRLAHGVLERYAELLGRGESRFVADIEEKIGGLYVFVLRQHHRGLPVKGGRADLRLHESGRLSMLGSRAVPIPAGFDLTPRLDVSHARLLAFRHLQLRAPAPLALQGRRAPRDRLVVWADVERPGPTPVRLAWEIDVDVPGANTVGKVWVDARTGRVLEYRSDVHECEACAGAHPPGAPPPFGQIHVATTGWALHGLGPSKPFGNVTFPRLKVEVVGGKRYYTDAAGLLTIPTTKSQEIVEFFLAGRHIADIRAAQGKKLFKRMTLKDNTFTVISFGSASSPEFERSQTTVYVTVDDVNRWVRDIVGRNSPKLNALDRINATVNVNDRCNATYARNSMRFYAAGGGCPNTAYKTVIQHEWGHGLDDMYGGISRTEGLSEGNADVVAIFRTGQPIVGHDFRGPGKHLRTALNTKTYPPSGTVHDQGEVWMGMCWDVRTNLIAKLGKSVGESRAKTIVFATIVADATSQRAATRELFVADDDDGNLCNGTPNYKELEKAALKRKMPYPKIPCGTPGKYSLFGPGCPGTGSGRVGDSRNGAVSAIGKKGPLGAVYALPSQAADGLPIEGIALYTASAGTVPVKLEVELFATDTAGKPLAKLAGPLTTTVGTTPGWYTAKLPAALPLPPGSRYAIVFEDPGIVLPIATAGGYAAEHFVAPKKGAPWVGPHLTEAWAWRILCSARPRTMPMLGHAGTPVLGGKVTFLLHSARPAATAMLWFGGTDKTWGGVGLPLDLFFVGAPGCPVLVSWDFGTPVKTDALGTAGFTLRVPAMASLKGGLFFNQWLVFDAAANPGGVVVTNAGRGVVGG